MKKLLLSIGSIAAVTTPAIAITSCGGESPEESTKTKLKSRLDYYAKWSTREVACGLGNIHDQFTDREKKNLEKSDISPLKKDSITASWAWGALSKGVFSHRNTFELLLSSDLLTHLCSKDADFELHQDVKYEITGDKMTGTQDFKNISWTANGKKILMEPASKEDGRIISFTLKIGDLAKKSLISGVNETVTAKDVTNFTDLFKSFAKFVKSELSTEDQEKFFKNLNDTFGSTTAMSDIKELFNNPENMTVTFAGNKTTLTNPVMVIHFGTKKLIFRKGYFLNVSKYATDELANLQELNTYIKSMDTSHA